MSVRVRVRHPDRTGSDEPGSFGAYLHELRMTPRQQAMKEARNDVALGILCVAIGFVIGICL